MNPENSTSSSEEHWSPEAPEDLEVLEAPEV
jgi:hypothetical protein